MPINKPSKRKYKTKIKSMMMISNKLKAFFTFIFYNCNL